MSNLKTNANILQNTLQTLNDKGYIANLQEKNILPTNNSQKIVADEGYDGLSLVNIEGNKNLVPENLRIGANIFGIEGTFVRDDYTFEDAFIKRNFNTYKNDRIKKIGVKAFTYCKSLSSVDFPACISIGNEAFYSCSSLTSISFPVCTNIGYSAFYMCTSLTSVSFPVCTNINDAAFYYCPSLTSVSFPVCTSIGTSAFYRCTSLTSVSFPVCTRIGGSAFYSCDKLITVNFPSCLTINFDAFGRCCSLTAVSFPACISIGSKAFSYCTSLTTVSFIACTSIGSYAFAYCSSLTSAYFGNSTVSKTTTLFSQAFSNCTKLTNLTLYYPSVATLSNINAFNSTPMSVSTLTGSFGSIYVPASLVDAYKSATNWVTYADRITAIPGSATLINFTIDGVSYQAEEDMTWNSWISSSYNTGGFLANEDTDSITNSNGYEVLYNSTAFSPSTTIIGETAYTLSHIAVPT